MRWIGKWCGREAAVTYALRQLKFPSSNINKLDKPVAVSTGTFVIHSVIHQCDSCWLKLPPRTYPNLTTSKKGLKVRGVVVCPAQNINEKLSLKPDKPFAGLGLRGKPPAHEAGRYLAVFLRNLFGWGSVFD